MGGRIRGFIHPLIKALVSALRARRDFVSRRHMHFFVALFTPEIAGLACSFTRMRSHKSNRFLHLYRIIEGRES